VCDNAAMPTQTERVNKYYEATTFDYHTVWTGRNDHAIHFGYFDTDTPSHSQSLLNMNRVLAARAGITAADSVLDAGCGYGGSSIWLARTIGCRVLGLNIVPFQIAKAKRYARRAGVGDKVDFALQDYAHTTLPEASFDVVWGLESIVHAPDKAAVVREAYRLLKPGGRLIIAEYTLREQPPLTAAESDSLTPWLEGWAMPSLLQAGEYLQLFRSAGFERAAAEDITEHVLPSLRRLEKILIALPVGRFLKRIGVFSKEHLGNMEGSRVQIEALKSGYWRYTILTAQKPA